MYILSMTLAIPLQVYNHSYAVIDCMCLCVYSQLTGCPTVTTP